MLHVFDTRTSKAELNSGEKSALSALLKALLHELFQQNVTFLFMKQIYQLRLSSKIAHFYLEIYDRAVMYRVTPVLL
jgi:hypothetical protein